MLGDTIREYRKANNLSQDELAEKLNVTRQSISLWETGQTLPTLENIVALAGLFHISTDQLLVEGNEPSAAEPVPGSPAHSKKKKTGLVCLIAGGAVLVAALAAVLIVWVFPGIETRPAGPAPVSGEPSAPMSDPEEDPGSASATTAKRVAKKTTVKKTAAKRTTAKKTTAKTDAKTTTAAKPAKAVDLYATLKSFVVKNGKLNGDYCSYSKTSDHYGGREDEDFSLYYWGDTDTVEFCLHSVQDDTFSINFYLRIPKSKTGEYEYISSYYYRDNGEPVNEAKGTITAAEFTRNYPLRCTRYTGSSGEQNSFMEISRVGICDLLDCLKEFMAVEAVGFPFSEFGFKNFE